MSTTDKIDIGGTEPVGSDKIELPGPDDEIVSNDGSEPGVPRLLPAPNTAAWTDRIVKRWHDELAALYLARAKEAHTTPQEAPMEEARKCETCGFPPWDARCACATCKCPACLCPGCMYRMSMPDGHSCVSAAHPPARESAAVEMDICVDVPDVCVNRMIASSRGTFYVTMDGFALGRYRLVLERTDESESAALARAMSHGFRMICEGYISGQYDIGYVRDALNAERDHRRKRVEEARGEKNEPGVCRACGHMTTDARCAHDCMACAHEYYDGRGRLIDDAKHICIRMKPTARPGPEAKRTIRCTDHLDEFIYDKAELVLNPLSRDRAEELNRERLAVVAEINKIRAEQPALDEKDDGYNIADALRPYVKTTYDPKELEFTKPAPAPLSDYRWDWDDGEKP